MFNKFSLILSSVKSALLTNKQEFLTLLHLRSFMQLQNLRKHEAVPLKIWSNYASYHFWATQVRNVSYSCEIFFPFSEFIAISIFALCCMCVLASNAQISMNWNLMLNFVKLKRRISKRHSSSYWPNIGVGDIERFAIFNLLASAWDPKSRFDQSDLSSANRTVETLLVLHQRFFVRCLAIYLRYIVLHHIFIQTSSYLRVAF